MFTTYCECGEAFHAADEHAGRSIQCRACGRQVALAPATGSIRNLKPASTVNAGAHPAQTHGAWDGKRTRNYVPRSRKRWSYIAAGIVLVGLAVGAAYFAGRARAARAAALEPASASDDGR